MAAKSDNKNLDMQRKILTSLPNQNSKTIMAVILVTVMILMWTKVILKNRLPSNTRASSAEEIALIAAQTGQSTSTVLTHIQLPFIEGRHDKISRDIFVTDNWKAFPHHATVNRNGKNNIRHDRDNIEKIAASIRLNAIIKARQNEKGEAFIENKLLTVGSKFEIDYEGKTFEFTIEEIYENRVVVKWQDYVVDLRMSKSGN